MTPKKSKLRTRTAPAKGDRKAFYMGTALALYANEEGETVQEYFNLLLEFPSPVITREGLEQFNRGVMSRIHKERNVPPDRVKNIILTAITPLGLMTPEEFHGKQMPAENA